MYTDFDSLPENARVWIFQSTNHLDVNEVEDLSAAIMNFLNGWQAHGNDLKASFTILYNRFLVISLDQDSYQATGCSIDKLIQLIQKVEQNQNLSLLDRMQVAYREDGLIHAMPLNAFREEVENGEYNAETVVFNNLIETK